MVSQPRTIRLGGPIFMKSEDPGELAREHRRLGYSAAYCPEASPSDATRIRDVRTAFAAENVVIAEVGAWNNMLDEDPERRKKNLQYVVERLALAEAVGARCCVDIAGSYNPKLWDGPDPRNLSQKFFEATVANCRYVIDQVKPERTKFPIDMMSWCLPDVPDSYLHLIRAVDRPAFGVHVDICNIVNSPQRYYHNSELIAETFHKLGRWITSCHAKDLSPRSVHFAEDVPGRGGIDYRAYLRKLASLPVDAPLMLEHLQTPADYDEARSKRLEQSAV
ncbi:MAG: xylose isomerase [Acidobacteria bacterium]|nr:MAG: xylose isomerase [Acidobacteriota bacterium]